MNFNLKKPCTECPFRRKAIRGWLGPWETEELLWALGRESFPCHQTIKGDGDPDEQPKLESCAGMAIFLNNKLERSRNPDNVKHQDMLRDSEHAADVFRTGDEFREHHNG